MRSRTHRTIFGALLAVASVASTTLAAAPPPPVEKLEVRWKQACRYCSADSSACSDKPTRRVCLKELDAPVKLSPFTTIMVTLPDGDEVRYSYFAKKEGEWIPLTRAPAEQLCVVREQLQNSFVSKACGELGLSFTASECATFDEAEEPCEFRAVPFDNDTFPHFPDPSDKERYFSPPAFYQTFGDTAGDVDPEFFSAARSVQHDADYGLSPPAQRAVDIFAWQWFLHLNWPTNARVGKRLDPGSGSLCPAWSMWRQADDVMARDCEVAPAWGAPPQPGARVCDKRGAISHLHLTSATSESPPQIGGPTNLQPGDKILWDRDGAPVFYDARINRTLYDDVVFHSLHTKQGLLKKEVVGVVDVDLGGYYLARDAGRELRGVVKGPSPGRQGSIATKFAWKVLTKQAAAADEIEKRFIRAKATLAPDAFKAATGELRANLASAPNAEAGAPTVAAQATEASPAELRQLARLPWASAMGIQPPTSNAPLVAAANEAFPAGQEWSCRNQECDVALVGMHIAIKTGSSQQWVWSTFAHEDNFEGAQPSFVEDCTPPLGKGDAQTRTVGGRSVTHICPVEGPSQHTKDLNVEMKAVLATSDTEMFQRLAHYRLLGAQWIQNDPVIPSPEFLVNPVLETFKMKEQSCYACHNGAKVDTGAKIVQTDKMFFLTKPKLCTPPPP